MSKKPGFVREATGLVRELGLIDAIAINLFAAAPISAVFIPLIVGSLFPGANIYLFLTIGAILAVFNGLVYSLLSAAMPRAGGDYIYNGRILHPAIGFMTSWGFTISQFLILAIGTSLAVTTILAPSISTTGYLSSDAALVTLGSMVGTPLYTWAIGTVMLLVVVFIVLLPTRGVRRVLEWTLIIGTLGGLTTPIVFLTSNHAEFVRIFDQFMLKAANLPDAYNAVMSTAYQLGFKPGNFLTTAILAIPVAYFLYVGFTWSIYAGGEVRNAPKNQIRAIEIALLVDYIYVMITFGGYYSVSGGYFNDAVAWVSSNFPASNKIPVAPSVSLFAGLLAPNLTVNVIMQASIFLYAFMSLVAIAVVCVRNIFAWSFDRAFPEVFASVTNKGSPWVATILTAVCAETLLAVYNFTTFFTLTVNYTVIFSIAFFITGFAAVLFPYLRRDLFDGSPGIVRKKIGGLPVISAVGIVQLLLFGLILYSSFRLPAFSGPTGPEAVFFVAGIYITGLLGFFIVKAYRKREGIDLTFLQHEIPPE